MVKSLLCLLIFTTSLFAQNKVPFSVLDNSDNLVGERLVFHIKETIAKSHLYELSKSASMRITITTTSYNEENNNASIFSIVWLQDALYCEALYLTSTLGYVGADGVKEMAESIVARFDNVIEKHKISRLEMILKERQYKRQISEDQNQD